MEQHKQWKLDKKLRHARWKKENLDYLDSVGLKYESFDNGAIVKVADYAQFSPSTGRWFCLKTPWNVMKGGAKCFVGWLKKNEVWT